MLFITHPLPMGTEDGAVLTAFDPTCGPRAGCDSAEPEWSRSDESLAGINPGSTGREIYIKAALHEIPRAIYAAPRQA